MKHNKVLIAVLIIIIILTLGTYLIYKNKNTPVVNEPAINTETEVIYNNTEYGFTFSLPLNWKGYTIVKQNWEGSPINDTKTKQTGPKLLVRNPAWTAETPYEDIPILIFTISQWDSYIKEDFAVSAAPIQAGELGRNNIYVFALPPRWDFDYSKGYEEAQNIVKSKPLKPYSL